MSNGANPNRNPFEENTSSMSSGNMATAVSEQAEQAGNFIAEKANEAGQYVSEMAKNAGSTALHSAQNAASYVGEQAEQARTAVGSGIKSVSETIKSAAPQEEGVMHDAARSVADSLESCGQYIAEHDFAAMGEDLTNVIRRNPIPSVLIAAGFGFLLARACTSTRSNY
jgi:ElaB/YqjD/DUF883 family membrane-anchored ribosome-binding protein